MADDTRPRATYDKSRVNPRQLADELGAALAWSDNELVVVDGRATQGQLEGAIARHVPSADFGMTADQRRLRDLRTKAKAGSLSTAEVAEAVNLLLRLGRD